MAIDRQAINDAVLDGNGFPAYQPIFEGRSGFVEALNVDVYDPDAAVGLLEGAGVSDLEFTVIDPGIQPATRLIEIVQQMFAEIGVTMNVEIFAGAAARSTYREGNHGAFLSAILTSPDPSTVVSGALVGPDSLGNTPPDLLALANTALGCRWTTRIATRRSRP